MVNFCKHGKYNALYNNYFKIKSILFAENLPENIKNKYMK